jgi:hypothetical protein
MRIPVILLVAILLAKSGVVSADIIAQANFQSGTVESWNQVFDAAAVTVVANAGPAGAGDFAIRAIPNPNNLFMFPQNGTTAGFVGNYVASGAVQVQFDYRGVGSLASGVELYAVMLNTAGNRWVSVGNVVPTSSWQTATISITEPNLVHPLGSNSWATDFATIDLFGFRFQVMDFQSGGSSVGAANYELFLDNIQLQSIPEPAAAGAGLLALALAVARQRRSR